MNQAQHIKLYEALEQTTDALATAEIRISIRKRKEVISNARDVLRDNRPIQTRTGRYDETVRG